jgi:hypothetical protein
VSCDRFDFFLRSVMMFSLLFCTMTVCLWVWQRCEFTGVSPQVQTLQGPCVWIRVLQPVYSGLCSWWSSQRWYLLAMSTNGKLFILPWDASIYAGGIIVILFNSAAAATT